MKIRCNSHHKERRVEVVGDHHRLHLPNIIKSRDQTISSGIEIVVDTKRKY